MKQTVRPDPYADRCCITVRVFHCANRPPLQILTAVHHRYDHAAARDHGLAQRFFYDGCPGGDGTAAAISRIIR